MIKSVQSCSLHTETMNPTIWASLPSATRELIFARLSIRDLQKVSCINKEWRAKVIGNMYFHKLCDASHGKTIAFINSNSQRLGSYWIRKFDVCSKTWNIFEFFIKPTYCLSDWEVGLMLYGLGDRGWVFFLKIIDYAPIGGAYIECSRIHTVVTNLLSGVSYELPVVQGTTSSHLEMVKLIVDSQNKGFKVIMVLFNYKMTLLTTHLYDSTTKRWDEVNIQHEHIFREHRSMWNLFSRKGIYDHGKKILLLPGECQLLLDTSSSNYVQIEDHFFVLRAKIQTNGYINRSIEEFVFQIETRKFDLIRTHKFPPFQHPHQNENSKITMHSCRGFLMIIMQTTFINIHYPHDCRNCTSHSTWLYDLSSLQWEPLEFPKLPRCKNEDILKKEEDLPFPESMLDFNWSA